ncbi:MAG: NAD(P)H-binding protein [Bacteroidota bacterium]
MHILVIGASGRVGNQLTAKLLQANHRVVGTTRQEKQLFEDPNYSQINLDLLGSTAAIEANIPEGIEAIYFVSGSRGKDLLQVDLHGAVKTMKAAARKKVKRYILLSTVFALRPASWQDNLPEEMFDYYIAKHYADDWLIHHADLNYTILQPSALTEEQGSGKIVTNVEEAGENSIENVATTLFEVLNHPNAYHKVISMKDGEVPIKEAITLL